MFNICIDDVCENINITSNRAVLVENKYNMGDKVNINIDVDNVIKEIYIAYIDFDKFKENYEILNNNQLNIIEFKENYIKSNIIVEDNNVLFLSIPYEENFKIEVDGKEREYYKLFDNFIGLDLEEGYHEVEIKYEVKGFKLGFSISLLSMFIFACYLIFEKRKLKC